MLSVVVSVEELLFSYLHGCLECVSVEELLFTCLLTPWMCECWWSDFHWLMDVLSMWVLKKNCSLNYGCLECVSGKEVMFTHQWKMFWVCDCLLTYGCFECMPVEAVQFTHLWMSWVCACWRSDVHSPMDVLSVCVLKKCCMVSEQRLMQSCSSWLGRLSSKPNMSSTPMNPSVACRIALFSIAAHICS